MAETFFKRTKLRKVSYRFPLSPSTLRVNSYRPLFGFAYCSCGPYCWKSLISVSSLNRNTSEVLDDQSKNGKLEILDFGYEVNRLDEVSKICVYVKNTAMSTN